MNQSCPQEIRSTAILLLLCVISPASHAGYGDGGWAAWKPMIRAGDCSLMTEFLDQSTNNPNVDPSADTTNDPFFLTFAIPIESDTQEGLQIDAGELYLWLTPRPWEHVAYEQLNVFGAVINGVRMIEHVPAALSSSMFYLEGAAAKEVYESLKRDERINLELDLATNQVVSREVPTGQHFPVWSAMLEACYRVRAAPSAVSR